jgi:hypothetical protein
MISSLWKSKTDSSFFFYPTYLVLSKYQKQVFDFFGNRNQVPVSLGANCPSQLVLDALFLKIVSTIQLSIIILMFEQIKNNETEDE